MVDYVDIGRSSGGGRIWGWCWYSGLKLGQGSESGQGGRGTGSEDGVDWIGLDWSELARQQNWGYTVFDDKSN